MARPCKSARVLTDKSQTTAEINDRIEMEDRIGGGAVRLSPPKRLTKEQKKLWRAIVDGLKDADILRKLDVYILEDFVINLDSKMQVENDIREDPSLKYDPHVQAALKLYTSNFYRGCNELSLSPQSRAKIANLSTLSVEDKTADLMKLLTIDLGSGENEYSGL